MTLIASVFVIAAGVLLWGLLSSRVPRFGVVANGAAVFYVILSPPLSSLGFGWTVLGFLTVGFGLFASIGGVIERRQRATETSELPRATIRN